MLSPDIALILLITFGLAWIAMGIFWGRKAKNLDGFMLAGRNVGLALGAATAMATWVTSNTVMLAPQFAVQMGIWGLIAYATASFGLFLFAPMAFRIRQLIPNGYTSGDFIRLRYGKVAWIIFLIISATYSLAWLVSMAIAGGVVLNALSGLDYVIGMSSILLVCVVYTLFGGLYAVIGTDFVQSIIILIGVVVVGTLVLIKVDIDDVHAQLSTEQPMLLQVFMPVALLSIFNNMFFGFGEIFHNNVWWSRVFAMRQEIAPKAFFLSGLFWFPIPIAAGFIGLCAGALSINIPDPNMTGPLIASQVLGKAGAIVVFIVVFCSLASSIDSLLAATSDLFAEDVVRKMIKPDISENQLRKLSSVIIISLGVLTWALSFNKANLLEVLFRSGPLVGSAIWPVIAGLYWQKASSLGAILAMIGGSVAGSIAYELSGWYTATLISTMISMVIVFLARCINPIHFDWATLQEKSKTA
ncbi:MAG: sodium:solute symporter family protein [Verrucomicrobiota bacterium]